LCKYPLKIILTLLFEVFRRMGRASFCETHLPHEADGFHYAPKKPALHSTHPTEMLDYSSQARPSLASSATEATGPHVPAG